jgi:hypothetical protein
MPASRKSAAAKNRTKCRSASVFAGTKNVGKEIGERTPVRDLSGRFRRRGFDQMWPSILLYLHPDLAKESPYMSSLQRTAFSQRLAQNYNSHRRYGS